MSHESNTHICLFFQYTSELSQLVFGNSEVLGVDDWVVDHEEVVALDVDDEEDKAEHLSAEEILDKVTRM